MSVVRTRYVDVDALLPSPENVLAILRGDITPVRAEEVIEHMEPDPPINDESVDDGPDVEETASDDDGSSHDHIEGE